jgi:hypothetical protein
VRARAHEAAAELESSPSKEFKAEQVSARLAALEGGPAPAGPSAPPGVPPPWRRPLLWAVGGLAVAVLVVVLVLVTSGGGDEGATSTAASDREDVVPVTMNPVGGSRASGMIAIVRVADQPAVDLALRGLRPTGPGESYVLWFVGSGNRSLPVAFQGVGGDGRLTGRAPIPTAASGLLPSFTAAELTLTRQREAAAALERAGRAGTLPEPVGSAVLRGALR